MSNSIFLEKAQEAIDLLATRLWWQGILREVARSHPGDDVLQMAAVFAGRRTTLQFRVVRALLRDEEWATVPGDCIVCVPSLGLVAYPNME